jgi:Nuclease A inhibitor-like protein
MKLSLGILTVLAAVSVSTLGAGCAATTDAETPDEASIGAVDAELTAGDAAFQREVTQAAKGLTYISETDAPFTFVAAKLNAGETVNEAAVRRAFARVVNADPQADKPMSKLKGEVRTFESFRASYRNCDASEAASCAKIEAMNAILQKNLTDVKVFSFGKNGAPGAVDGVGVSIFVVGKTKSGQLAGVRTFAVWT